MLELPSADSWTFLILLDLGANFRICLESSPIYRLGNWAQGDWNDLTKFMEIIGVQKYKDCIPKMFKHYKGD